MTTTLDTASRPAQDPTFAVSGATHALGIAGVIAIAPARQDEVLMPCEHAAAQEASLEAPVLNSSQSLRHAV